MLRPEMFARAGLLLRRHITGRVVVRPGLPRLRPSPARQAEVSLYATFAALLLSPTWRGRVRRVVDVGCGSWSYAAALAQTFPAAHLLGVEVDGHRRFTDLYRRVDHARAHAAACGRPAQVVQGDFRLLPWAPAAPGPVLVTFFFPFVSAAPARAWGLPATYADFGGLLSQARGRATGWLSVHQGEAEAVLAQEAYAAHGIEVRVAHLAAGSLPDLLRHLYDPWVIAGKGDTAGTAPSPPDRARRSQRRS